MKSASPHDEYIAKAADFAVPILKKIRKAVHKACPGVQESMRWSTPNYDHEGMLVGMAAFKQHVNLVFWRGKELSDPDGLFEIVGKTAIGNIRLEKVSDVPTERVLAKYLKEAMRLNEAALSKPKETRQKAATKQVAAPADLLAALRKRKSALATFEGFSYSNRKEYVGWIAEAKREATREKRIATAVEWMAEGKPRNWKYMKEWG